VTVRRPGVQRPTASAARLFCATTLILRVIVAIMHDGLS
jgi:hypothetical protein